MSCSNAYRTLIAVTILICLFNISEAQSNFWQQTNGPYGGTVKCFTVSGTSLFAGTDGGVFLSTNNGTIWTSVGLTNTIVRDLAVSGMNLFAGTWGGGVFLSTNNGTIWTAVNTGLTNTSVVSLAISSNGVGGTNLFAGTSGGVFLSSNNGSSWTAVNTGLTNTFVCDLAVSGTNLFAGTYSGGIFLSTNNGTSWTAVNTGLTDSYDRYVRALAVSGTNIFAGTFTGVFLSTNNGTSWTAVNTGLTNTSVNTLAVSGTNILAGINGGVFLSTDNGTSWTATITGLTNAYVRALAVSGTNLFAGTDGGVFLSTNNSISWIAASTGLTNAYVNALGVSSTNLFAGTSGNGVFLSTNNGTSWTAVNTGLTNTAVYALAFSPNGAGGMNIFAGTIDGVFLSANYGTSWTAASIGLTNTFVNALSASGTNIFAGTFGGGVFLSTNNGTSWTAVGLTNTIVHALAVSGTNLFAGTSGGVFLSTNNGTNWAVVNTGLTDSYNRYVRALAVSGTNIFAGINGGNVVRGTVTNDSSSVPQNLEAVALSDRAALRWKKSSVPSIFRYRIYRSNPLALVDSTQGGSDTLNIIIGLSGGTTYSFRVCAVDSSNNESGLSNEVTIIPSPGRSLGDVSHDGTISAFDASLTLQHAASIAVLTNLEDILVGDVTANSQLSAYDASQTLRFAAGLITNFPTNVPSPSATSVSLPALTSQIGDTIQVPITVGDLTGKDITSYQFDVEYDTTSVKITGISSSSTLSSGISMLLCNLDSPRRIRVAGAGVAALAGSGTLLNLSAQAVKSGTSILRFLTFQFNEGKNTTNSSNGSIDVTIPTPPGSWTFRSNTGKTANVAIPNAINPTIGATHALRTGDAVGVFFSRNDSLICAGSSLWQEGQNIAITAWGDNDQTTMKDGFNEGELICFKIWDGRAGKEYFAKVAYQSGPGVNYQTNGIYALSSLVGFTNVAHSIVLPQGWNMISSFVTPKDSTLDSLYAKIKSRIVIMKNGPGQVFWPTFTINTIGKWKSYHGYQLYMNSRDTVTITGDEINPQQYPMSLPQGWNMISYLRNSPMRSDSALSTISSKLVIAKNGAGQVYWPAFSINTIGSMKPGQGYQMYLSSVGTLTYPANAALAPPTLLTKTVLTENSSTIPEPTKYRVEYSNTGSSAILIIEGSGVKEEEEIGVWTQKKKLVGSGVVTNGKALVTVWGDDEMTEEVKEGVGEGETLVLTAWSGKERTLKIGTLVNGLTNTSEVKVLQYNKDRVWIARIEEEVGAIPREFVLDQNFPNPFNPSTTIGYGLPKDAKVTLEIYDVLGRRVTTLVNSEQKAGYYSVQFQNRALVSGIYFYTIVAGEFKSTKKFALIK
ncbi:MAG: cohesin domain-containing protein [bacterium]